MSLTTKTNSHSQGQGFTLIELVIVIIVLGILAAGAIPKLTSKSSFEPYTVRDQLIARLRLVQLQGMNADPANGATDNACYWLVVQKSCFYHEHTARKSNGKCNKPSPSNAASICSDDSYTHYNPVTFTEGMFGNKKLNYRFDSDGKLTSDSAASPIVITGDSSLTITIESEGYIHEK